MKNVRLAIIITTVCAIGGTILASSTFAEQKKFNRKYLEVKEVNQHSNSSNINHESFSNKHIYQQNTMSEASQKIELVAPPSELPEYGSNKMTASLKSFAPVSRVKTINKPRRRLIVKRPTTNSHIAQAIRPRELFTLVRMLNYSPHPQKEEILKKNPLRLGQSNYWFTVEYDEDWKVSKNDIGHMKGLSFEINVMENNRKIRTLKTPKIRISSSTIKKGQILGIAEVAPYKFTITVDSYTKNKKGVSELVFKLALVG